MSCNDDKTYEPCSCGCGGSSDCTCDCNECAPVNCIEQAIRDALATLQEQLEALVKRAEDAAKASEDAAAASAASASEAKGYRDAAELAATTATNALKTITDVALTLEETAQKLKDIADQLSTAIAGIAVVTWHYTAEDDNQTVILVPESKNALDVQAIYIEGIRQDPGRGFVYDKTTNMITLAKGIPLGLEIVIILGTYSDNPTDFPQTLASNNGASLIGTTSDQTVQEELDELESATTANQNSISALRSDLASVDAGKGDALIAVKQPLTGTISRNQHDKNAESVSIDDFGAKGDGVTIDDAAFQLAVDSGAAHITLTAGKTYRIKNGFEITKSLTLSGYGAKLYYSKPDASYYHCIRVGNSNGNTSNVTLEGFGIYCDPALVRNDTGFGISIVKGINIRVEDITLSDIGLAGMWATDTDVLYINRVTVISCDADGIHISDGCSNFFITNCLVRNCNDDAIAVVSDVPGDGRQITGGVVANNIVTDNRDGHAYVAIGCINVIWDGNVARGCKGPGFGSYLWQTDGAPADEDYVRNCKFTNNLIEACGLNGSSGLGGTSFFMGALKDCVVEGNTIGGSPGRPDLGTQPNCMLIMVAMNVQIQRNSFHNSSKHGIYVLDSNTSDATTFRDLTISENTFNQIANDVVHIAPSADIGAVHFVNNILVNSPFDQAADRSLYISRTRTNRLTISGNKNTYRNLQFAYDTSTCTNVVTSDNSPAREEVWAVTITGDGATPSGSGQGYYTRDGDTITFTINVNITAPNGATSPIVNLPMPAKAVNRIWAVGRENSNTGAMVQCIPLTTSTMRIVKFDNSTLLTGTPSMPMNILLHGSYLVA